MSQIATARAAKERKAEVARVLAILRRWGIDTLGQFAALDKEAVGARLGPIGLQLWERAKGKTTRLLKLVSVPETVEEGFELANEIETSEPLLFMLRRFLQQFSVRLGGLHLVASELQLQITFSDKSSYRHQFKIPDQPITSKSCSGCCTRISRILLRLADSRGRPQGGNRQAVRSNNSISSKRALRSGAPDGNARALDRPLGARRVDPARIRKPRPDAFEWSRSRGN